MSIFSFIPLELKIHIASICLKDDKELIDETMKNVFNNNINSIPENKLVNNTNKVFFTNAWYKLTQIDDEFNKYSKSNAGIKLFINLFTITLKNDKVNATTLFGELHSINDEPAYYSTQILYYDFVKIWFFNGKVHRHNNFGDDENFPTIIYEANGTNTYKWYKDGLLHRENDLPSAIYNNNYCKIWHKYGKRHREADPDQKDLPAFINLDGLQEWWVNGYHHRDDDYNPVIIRDNIFYYKNDISYEYNNNDIMIYEYGKLIRDIVDEHEIFL
jgi:hypothetical protein